jgi:hypothetical protein
MTLNRPFWATLFMLVAFVFFVCLALVEAAVWKSGPNWFLGGGLASMVLSFLCGGGWAAWNTRPGV